MPTRQRKVVTTRRCPHCGLLFASTQQKSATQQIEFHLTVEPSCREAQDAGRREEVKKFLDRRR